ncbi:MAG: regulatory protein RecX [Bacteroidia bacterium]|nr:recombination regulator RecX [Bacteroidia bacterium]MDW8334365.1 regulatory protein RecX [Bacteroidia bacterium]
MRKRIIRKVGVGELRRKSELSRKTRRDKPALRDDGIYALAVRFCLYRERCSSEIRAKLYRLGADPATTEKYLSYLKEEGYYDDARYCREFAYGKLRSRAWGKEKIRLELQSRFLDERDIEAALDALEPDLYEKQIKKLARQKFRALLPSLDRRRLVFRYLRSRGFSAEEIRRAVDWRSLESEPSPPSDRNAT